MKFGYISGDDLRSGRINIPKVITYTKGYHIGETHNVIPQTIVINCHASNLYERNYKKNGMLEQVYFEVPENVRIFFYTLPGNVTCRYEHFKTKNICKNKFTNVTLVYEHGDEVPEFLLNVVLPIYEERKLIPPFVYFCNDNNGYDLKTYAEEELDIPISSTDRTSFKYLTNKLSNNEPGLFLNIHILACNSFGDHSVKEEIKEFGSVLDTRPIEAHLASLSIGSNPRITSDTEDNTIDRFRRQMVDNYDNFSLNPFQMDGGTLRRPDSELRPQNKGPFELHFGKMSKPIPTNMKLYNKIKNIIKRKVARWPSAYASGQLVKMYRRLGGKYKKGKRSSSSLNRWYKERWVDVCTGKPCGRKRSSKRNYPYCRPSKKISSKTPKTVSQFSKAELKRRCLKKRKLKYKTMRFGKYLRKSLISDIIWLKKLKN